MKTISLFILLLSVTASAGQEGGGGGHPCKADFMEVYSEVTALIEKEPKLARQAIAERLVDVLDPKRVHPVELEIVESRILGCRLTDNPIACSNVHDSKITLYCGEGGWMSLTKIEKVKHMVHELLWWSPRFKDANYAYSTPFTKTIEPYLALPQTGFVIQPNIAADIQILYRGSLEEAILLPKMACETLQKGNIRQEIHIDDRSLFSAPVIKSKNSLYIQLSAIKPIVVNAPKRESKEDKSHCELALFLHYRFKGQQRPSEIRLAKIQIQAGSTVDVTNHFISNIGGTYMFMFERHHRHCTAEIKKKSDNNWIGQETQNMYLCH